MNTSMLHMRGITWCTVQVLASSLTSLGFLWKAVDEGLNLFLITKLTTMRRVTGCNPFLLTSQKDSDTIAFIQEPDIVYM
jgi:hypothetical protein